MYSYSTGVDSRLYLPEWHVNVTNRNLRLCYVCVIMVTLRRCGAGIAHNATALVSVRCTAHGRYTEAPYVYSVRMLHDVIGVQPCIGWDHLAPSPGVDPAAGDRFIHRTPISLSTSLSCYHSIFSLEQLHSSPGCSFDGWNPLTRPMGHCDKVSTCIQDRR